VCCREQRLNAHHHHNLYLPPTKEEVGICFRPHAQARLSVCLSVCKILKNVCMDLDEMLHVNRCRDELINF